MQAVNCRVGVGYIGDQMTPKKRLNFGLNQLNDFCNPVRVAAMNVVLILRAVDETAEARISAVAGPMVRSDRGLSRSAGKAQNRRSADLQPPTKNRI
jgi:hypothetical protein